jgi:hypothetical protein
LVERKRIALLGRFKSIVTTSRKINNRETTPALSGTITLLSEISVKYPQGRQFKEKATDQLNEAAGFIMMDVSDVARHFHWRY